MTFQSLNPYTGELYFKRSFLSSSELNGKLTETEKLFHKWKQVPISQRVDIIRPIASYLREHVDDLALHITREMGKPIIESKAEIQKCALLVDYYIEEAPHTLQPETETIEGIEQGVRRDPTGAVLGVMPWNFPFWQVFRFVIPSILAGNVTLLKHAPNMPGTAEKIEDLILETTGHRLLTQLTIGVDSISSVLDHPIVRGACLTGSFQAGQSYASEAGQRIIPTVLELGSNDPFVILADADVEAACDSFLESRFGNTGQTCIAAKRLIVEQPVYDQVETLLLERIQKLAVQDPMKESTDLSCMAREDLAQQLESQWEESVAAGGEVLIQPEREGTRFSPGFLRKPALDSPAWIDELFGPVAVIRSAPDMSKAVQMANDTRFGLGASVWTSDLKKARDLIAGLDFGTVVVNQKTASDPRWPFGGFKDSGYGRELGKEGLLEFVNLKTYKIDL